MTIDPRLLEILVCPQDKGPLEYVEDEQVLVNPRLSIAYRVEDGIPVMLAHEAIEWSQP
ncbi:Trm112 family protein [Corynebacterium sp. ES2794-CONJ1]|uniref:Trm112 family protein n=1 Tax=unclassified Corynebacterium TaxID=2624378 RepID=UPI002167E314|nr:MULTISPECIES: Trm112 family protein [unclassified Corynebacterium]MCS4490760.1 Trm112 family protein [Corynebacterium sp. ES2775-CONJ]MCS4492562.1 Trm112 family protein [Corynebacterium sp. ES2715-CONJ3]MCS4532663.1 Trm112 family protein [Corynebacterium sp. ES2730-CONJ]MCU9520058.1 Trm112 family protein [Corynebacterium sp. ES2794-CONJ1]